MEIRDQRGLGGAIAAGSDSRIVIGKDCTASPELHISLGDWPRSMVRDGCSLAALKIEARDNAFIEIGNRDSFVFRTLLSLAELSHVTDVPSASQGITRGSLSFPGKRVWPRLL